MTEQARALLDQLMGKDRNLTTNERAAYRSSIHFTHPKVCKSFIAGFCEREAFAGTKLDEGPCMKEHDDTVRAVFQRENYDVRYQYEEEFYRKLKRFCDDADAKVRQVNASNAALLDQTQQSADLQQSITEDAQFIELTTKSASLQADLDALKTQAEALQQAGTDASILTKLMDEVKQNKTNVDAQITARRTEIESSVAASRPTTQPASETVPLYPTRMLVCDTCGLSLVAGDDEARMAAHQAGKQHLAMEKVREWCYQYEERKTRGEIGTEEGSKRAMAAIDAKFRAAQISQQSDHHGHNYNSSHHSHHSFEDRRDDRGRGRDDRPRRDDRDYRRRSRSRERPRYRSRSRSPARDRDYHRDRRRY